MATILGGFPVLRTERLVLREIVHADAEALFAFRSDPIEQKHNDPPLRTLDEAHELVDRLVAARHQVGAVHWGLTVAPDDTVRGLLGYNYWDPANHRAALGYDLARALWGRGYMTEALTAVLDHGFAVLDLNRVEVATEAANTASLRLLRRLGFAHEGTLHEHFRGDDDGYVDVTLWAMLRRDRTSPADVGGGPQS